MILPIIALLLVLGWVDIQHDIITGTVLVAQLVPKNEEDTCDAA